MPMSRVRSSTGSQRAQVNLIVHHKHKGRCNYWGYVGVCIHNYEVPTAKTNNRGTYAWISSFINKLVAVAIQRGIDEGISPPPRNANEHLFSTRRHHVSQYHPPHHLHGQIPVC